MGAGIALPCVGGPPAPPRGALAPWQRHFDKTGQVVKKFVVSVWNDCIFSR